MGVKSWVATVLGAWLFIFTGCAVTSTGPTKAACAITEIEWKITRKAQLTHFKCQPSDTNDSPALLFTADIQNSTSKPLRYRLSVVLTDLKKATGQLVPRKGVPPVVKPGATEQVTLVFENTAKWPEKAEVTLIVLPEQPELPQE